MAQNDLDYTRMQQHLKENKVEEPIQDILSLKFDSDFEYGNLDIAAKTFEDRNDEYDLVMRLDSNSRTHQQWFYFCVNTKGRGKYKG